MARPRIAWFTPLQPVESGISLYSEDLLPILSTVADIDVVVDGYSPSVLATGHGLRVRQARDFRPEEYDLTVFQVGNSPAHIYMLPEIERNPGLLVLHDTMVNHLFIQEAARNGRLNDYREIMSRRYGEPGRLAADRVLKGQAPDDLFRFPMNESLVESSRATLVHSDYARDEVLQRSPEAQVFRVPHGLRIPEYVEQTDARKYLGIPDDQFVVASVTHLNPYKRIDVVLRAFKQLRKRVPARLILAGSVSPNFPLGRMVTHLGLEQVVEMPGYVSDQEARLIAAAADVIVNLRYPTAGETSGSLLHSMAAGRPVIVSETGSFSEVPSDAVIRVPVDELELPTLIGVLTRLADDDWLRSTIGRRARQFIIDEHSMQRWANGYIDAFRELTGVDIPYPDSCHDEEESFMDTMTESRIVESDGLTRSVAAAVAELGLGGDDSLLREIARASVELRLGVGMMTPENEE